jgi:hypothetical protein
MSVRFTPALQEALDGLDGDLRAPAHAVGISLAAQLGTLRPAITHAPDQGNDPDIEVLALDLDGEGGPDPVSLAACRIAHDSYVTARGAPSGASLGALALARVLVWLQRAAVLGTPAEVVWIGPPQRRPDHALGIQITASCTALVDGTRRTARALAVVRPAVGTDGDG